MKIIDQYYEILEIMPQDPIKQIALAARNCYKSEPQSTPESDEALVQKLKNIGHFSPYEHSSAIVRLVTDRGVTHELVRHRLAAYAQESTRYCNYSKDKFGNEITFIRPVQYEPKLIQACQKDTFENKELMIKVIQDFGADKANRADCWYGSCWTAEQSYICMLAEGASPQEARSVLPNSTKTDIIVAANFREWLHIFKLRTSQQAHPQIRELMQRVQKDFQERFPIIFGKKEE